jgi:putative DNA methylase
MSDFPRLIEHAFPLKQASLDSVHEKNVRHGHILTLHIWPARRPLAACRAALIATLLPDPGTPEGRKELCERIGGRVVKRIEKKKMPGGQTVERVKEGTEGGILRWLEVEPEKSNKKKWREWKARSEHFGSELEWFRQEIRKAYGGRAPRVLDPFSGGGAIPLEAMRLGCDATAVDINPVAWFILKCTLEHPQKLAGQTRPLPEFILRDDAFMEEFFKKAKGYSSAQVKAALKRLHQRLSGKKGAKDSEGQEVFDFGAMAEELHANLAWHVRAWGQWVLAGARRGLAQYYPTYADFEPIKKDHISYEHQPMRLVPLREDGTPDIDALNGEFTPEYLQDKRNPRWIAKPTVAYLWARTVTCKNCRAEIPLLKTRWLCKSDTKRILLTLAPHVDGTRVAFGIETNVSAKGGNAAQRREFDRKISAGTMSRAGAKCACCPAIMTMEDIRTESNSGRSGSTVIAVVTEGPSSKEYRLPTEHELLVASSTCAVEPQMSSQLPRHSLDERFEPASTRSISAQLYGVRRWKDLFTPRQRLAMFALGSKLHAAADAMLHADEWSTAIVDSICLSMDRLACFLCVNTRWKSDADSMTDAFSRYSISLLWDFAEANPLGTTAGGFIRCNERIATAIDTLLMPNQLTGTPSVHHGSAGELGTDYKCDLIITDPPYYQAVSYADLSDFFYTWLRGFQPRHLPEFTTRTTEKSKEFVQHIREDKDRATERLKYESQMEEAFSRARQVLTEEGRFVCVFAHKEPDAWETLASAIMRAGFVVTGSWPVQTEMPSRQRGAGVAALASSVWLICRPRPLTARPGWDNRVLEEMRQNIAIQLREFWDAGIRGPDFVWAATGPALEAYSKHPVVRKANEPNATMSVSEFLNHVRRMVVDYIVGQVLSGEKGADLSAADRLDDVTAYYLLHRHDFGMDEAPVGACILYATACGLSDAELERSWDILVGAGESAASAEASDEEEDEAEDFDADADAGAAGGGSKVKLKVWSQRKGRSLGHEAPEGKAVPLIDRIHRLMHLWRDGDLHKVDEYIDEHGLRRNELFKRVVQSLIELSNGSERSLLESISNHIGAKGAVPDRGPELFTTKTSND